MHSISNVTRMSFSTRMSREFRTSVSLSLSKDKEKTVLKTNPTTGHLIFILSHGTWNTILCLPIPSVGKEQEVEKWQQTEPDVAPCWTGWLSLHRLYPPAPCSVEASKMRGPYSSVFPMSLRLLRPNTSALSGIPHPIPHSSHFPQY